MNNEMLLKILLILVVKDVLLALWVVYADTYMFNHRKENERWINEWKKHIAKNQEWLNNLRHDVDNFMIDTSEELKALKNKGE